MPNNENDYITQLLTSIVNFKRKYYNQLCNSDKMRLRLWRTKLQDLEGVPSYGGHLVICPFSSAELSPDNDGPDTCVCSVPALIEWKFDRLVKEYGIQTL